MKKLATKNVKKHNAVVEKNQTLCAIDFFCGAGGMTFGLRSAGIKVLGGIDVDESCRKTYEENNPSSKFISEDITRLQVSKLQKLIDVKYHDDNLILVGCSPCQFWSKVNTERKKSKKTAFLLKEFTRFIEELKPGWVIIENVPGIVNKRGTILPLFFQFLESLGYTFSYEVLDLSLYKIPQTRNRFVLIANRLGLPTKLPQKSLKPKATVRQYIGVENGFPSIPAGHRDDSKFIHSSSRLSPVNLARIDKTPKDGGRRSAWKNILELKVAAYEGRDNQFSDVYSRMAWDKPSPTITTRFNSFSNGCFGHPVENRALSLREGATLQTFPKSYRFNGSVVTIARHIGNAVPPLFAKQLGFHIIEQQEKI